MNIPNTPLAESRPFQVYLHVPFCERKCHYCDFASWELPTVQQKRWLETMLREMEMRSESFRGRPVSTVFLGGGTPSLLLPRYLETLMVSLRTHFDLATTSEISIECNPSSLNPEKLNVFSGLGINRLSIGIQTFQPRELQVLGRVHGPEGARRALATAASDGRFRFSGDLIFGVPGQTRATFLENLRELVNYRPSHVSFYGLSIEPGTPFEEWARTGKIRTVDDEEYNAMYREGVAYLESEGFERYEVSNFALAGMACRHNQGYWDGVEYLALGPGSHSFVGNRRSISPTSFEAYLAWGEQGFPESGRESEDLSRMDKVTEYLSLSLRQSRGLDRSGLVDLGFRLQPESILRWLNSGYLTGNLDNLRLSGEGWLVLDEICADLLARGEMLSEMGGDIPEFPSPAGVDLSE